ncbi:MAG: hypothetical protein LKF53_00625 [Solobacterium sp.]|jgi:hypothetical protein|nr:hypothetical protein [Solobacterium sp.]MCH4204880.1 hypothetical protein [Solobacterium sp.]MCH4226272.1 hypothetical protein [Solobacterium sp.]MCH4281673.1 hypothetical protein [Solobacterium sp.]
MNLITWSIVICIAVLAVLDLIYIAHHGVDSCGGNCTQCGGKCKWAGDIAKAKRSIARKKRLRAFFHLDRAD